MSGPQARTKSVRAKAFILNLAAECLQEDARNPKLIEDMRSLAADMKRDGRGQYSDEYQKKIDRQRTLFNTLPTGREKNKLKEAMMQQAYDRMWDGDTDGCDALLEFLPSDDASAVLDAWELDIDPHTREADRSRWYRREGDPSA